jgi:IDEAL domain
VKTMVKYGDVVQYEYYGITKKGFVDKIYDTHADVLIFVRKDKTTNEWNYLPNCNKDFVEINKLKVVETPIQPQDLNFMIDLALSTKDKQWFDELTQRKKYLLVGKVG